MPPYRKPNVDDILRKHGARIERNMSGTVSSEDVNLSKEYVKFLQEKSDDFSKYERWCHSLGSAIKMNISKKDREGIQKYIDIAHLGIEPWQALTLGVMAFLSVFMFGLLSSVAVILIKGDISSFPFLYFFLMVIFSLFLFYFVNGYPQRLANKWRLKASSQMVPAILYVVVYMRHTPNLEKAIEFASQHLQNPLSLDLRKVFYNVEIGKFSTIKESLDNYLEGWRDYSTEFIEAFHLIESSLYEPDSGRRIATLEKGLQVILDGVYEKMLRFTHDVKSPLTNVYMLGVVLPTLGLALLPLASAMLGGMLTAVHVFVLFNMIIPFLVFYLTDRALMLRPGGHGESSFLENNPLYAKFKDNSAFYNAFLISLPFFILGFLPLLFQYTPIPQMLGLQNDYTFAELGLTFLGKESIFGFVENGSGGYAGPFGFISVCLGLLIPLGVALFFSIGYSAKTKELIKERDKTKQLEREFNNSLFQLGNRIGNGVPPELVFGRVAESSRGLMTEDFFKKVNYNIRQMGMGVDKAIFHPTRGAILAYPSELISTSMRVLIEASKKGLSIAAISLMSISEYVKNIQKIGERLNDLLAEVISDMKSNMTFLAPLLSGIVVGLSLMISSILGKLQISELAGGNTGVGNLSSILTIFEMSKMISPYFLQISVGIYLIEIVFILTSALITIESGEDKLEKANKTGKNLIRGVMLYVITAFLSSFILFILSSVVLGNLV